MRLKIILSCLQEKDNSGEPCQDINIKNHN